MFKFKKGDKAKVTQGEYTGIVVEIDQDCSFQPWIKLPNGDRVFIREEYMELSNEGDVYERAWSDYELIVINNGEHKGKKYVVTTDSDDGTIRAQSLDKLASDGWKLKTDDTELTLAQVAERFNIPLDKLRIKE